MADPEAALALLNVNKTLSEKFLRRKSKTALPEPPKFDRLGRRIVAPITITPSLTRANSGITSTTTSRVATPQGEVELDKDIERAKTLMRLYEIRDRIKQQESTGLSKARERVDNVATKYARIELERMEREAESRRLRITGS